MKRFFATATTSTTALRDTALKDTTLHHKAKVAKTAPEAKKKTEFWKPEEIPTALITPNHIKLVSWNICSFKSCLNKGLRDYVKAEQADILCLQETKLGPSDQLPELEGYDYKYKACSTVKAGYSGTAVYSKIKPLKHCYGLPNTKYAGNEEGRCISLSFNDFTLVTVYTPNAGEGLKRLKERQEWDKAFCSYVRELDRTTPVLMAGDFNCAKEERDLSRPKQNLRSAGFTLEERAGFHRLLNQPFLKTPAEPDQPVFLDSYRCVYPEKLAFSYYSYRFQCRPKGLGWRLDYVLVSERWKDRLEAVDIREFCWGASDHVPIMAVFRLGDPTKAIEDVV